MGKPSDPLKPPPSLLVKLGSALIHAEEFFSPFGHEFDKSAFYSVAIDPEVREWVDAMNQQAFLPVKRNKAP